MAKRDSDKVRTKLFHRIQRFFDLGDKSKDTKLIEPEESYRNQPLVSLEKATEPLVAIIPDVKNMVAYAKQHCNTSSSTTLTSDQSAAIMLYTMEWFPMDQSLFRVLNKTLRDEISNELRPWLLYLKLFTTALDSLPPVSETIYRGVKNYSLDGYHEGEIIIWKGFSSCTRTMGALHLGQFLGLTDDRTLFMIESFSGKDIRKYSAHPNENEILLLPHRQFLVVSNIKQGDLTMVQLKEVTAASKPSATASASLSGPTPSPSPSLSPSHRLKSITIEIIPDSVYCFSSFKPSSIPSTKDKYGEDAFTIAGGQGNGNEFGQLNCPRGSSLDSDNEIVFIADTANNRIMAWKLGTNDVRMMIGLHGKGHRLNQLNYPTDILINKNDSSLIICDRGNRRVVRWFYNPYTLSVSEQGEVLLANITCESLAIDHRKNLYVSNNEKHQVERYRLGDSKGIIVAGGHGEGSDDHQLNRPGFIFVTDDQSIYVSDELNHRVVKWREGWKRGTVVAGGHGYGERLDQLWFPQGLSVNDKGDIFVADSLNHRIVCWSVGKREGRLVVGGRGGGPKANQLLAPQSIFFDQHGNLYVVDRGNARLQTFFCDSF